MIIELSKQVRKKQYTNMKKFLIAGLLLASAFGMNIRAQQYDDLTKMMLRTYAELLEQDPRDYKTYFERGVMYSRMGQYDEALTDLTKALQYTPQKETEYAVTILSSISDIQATLENYETALESIEKAIELDPNSYGNRYKKGNILLKLNRPDEALGVFRGLQNLRSRSQEALYGMARAYIMKNNYTEAEDLVKEIEQLDPSNYNTYCRMGDLYFEMGRHEDAAASYLSGFALAKNGSRPLESLYNVAAKDYPAFERAIDYAIGRTTNKLPLYYIKGNIANTSGNYDSAIDALSKVAQTNQGDDASVFAGLARAYLGLGNLAEAETNIEKAVAMEPTPKNLLIKSEIEYAKGSPAAALISATRAAQVEMSNDALVAQALSNLALDNVDDAMSCLNEAVMTDPGDILPLMIRGYVNSTVKGDAAAARNDYERASRIDGDTFPVIAYKAMARNFIGKKLDASAMIEEALKKDSGKDACYYAAVYYAQTGDLAKGREMLDRAKSLGYNNNYNLLYNNKANLNITPLRQ